jgi:hypothetical protein
LAAYNRERNRALKLGNWDSGKRRRRQCSLFTPLASIAPSAVDIAWAAGFLEGEGAFVHAGRGIRVKAVQVNEEPLHKLQRIFGGKIYKQKIYGSRQQSFLWVVNGRMAEQVIKLIYDTLSARRQRQASALLYLRP